ncbi:MAG: glutamyl-tRNA reductase [Acidobacteria bacterium]|nr:glutamyl-tRNA reductase [Acidobacteriota bacterium]
MRNLVIGINFKTAPLHKVAQVQFAQPSDLLQFLAALKSQQPFTEAFFLQTCNRREFYIIEGEQSLNVDQFLDLLASHIGQNLNRADFFQLADMEATRHLLSVSSSLESMVLGETEITKQVKIQAKQAQIKGFAGKYIQAWVDAALRAAKRVRNETEITRNVISMASLASRFARQHASQERRSTIAFIGAGHYMASIMPHFAKLDCDFVFVNRSDRRDLAAQYHGTYIPLDQFLKAPPSFDVMVTATAASEPIFSKQWVHQQTGERPVLILDMALPKDVAKGVETLSNITLMGLEEMERTLTENRESRLREVPKANPILQESIDQLHNRWQEFDMAAIHQEIAAHYRATGAKAVDHLLKALPTPVSHDHELALRAWAEDLVKRLVHVPILGLKGVVDEFGINAVDAYTKKLATATPLFRHADRRNP